VDCEVSSSSLWDVHPGSFPPTPSAFLSLVTLALDPVRAVALGSWGCLPIVVIAHNACVSVWGLNSSGASIVASSAEVPSAVGAQRGVAPLLEDELLDEVTVLSPSAGDQGLTLIVGGSSSHRGPFLRVFRAVGPGPKPQQLGKDIRALVVVASTTLDCRTELSSEIPWTPQRIVGFGQLDVGGNRRRAVLWAAGGVGSRVLLRSDFSAIKQVCPLATAPAMRGGEFDERNFFKTTPQARHQL